MKILIIGFAVVAFLTFVLFNWISNSTSNQGLIEGNNKVDNKIFEHIKDEKVKKELKDIYQGFMSVKRGDWAEYKHITKENTTIMKAIYVGKENFEGEIYTGFEIIGFPTKGAEIELIAVQVWYSSNSTMHVFKTTQGVFRSIGNKQENEIYAETPDSFKPENIPENWEEFTFTTETGKVVKGIKFKTPKGEEIWLSSEVPFGIVKYVIGNYTVELRDFGEGEKIKISIEEVKNATIVG